MDSKQLHDESIRRQIYARSLQGLLDALEMERYAWEVSEEEKLKKFTLIKNLFDN